MTNRRPRNVDPATGEILGQDGLVMYRPRADWASPSPEAEGDVTQPYLPDQEPTLLGRALQQMRLVEDKIGNIETKRQTYNEKADAEANALWRLGETLRQLVERIEE